MARHPKGILPTATGWRAWVRVNGQPRACKRFPAETPIAAMQTWRALTRAALLERRDRPPVAAAAELETFAADAATYLKAGAAMPTIAERRRHVNEWVILFGDRTRTSITSAEIRAQRDRWLTWVRG